MNKMKFILGLCVLGIGFSAQAASFPCNKAVTNTEKTICRVSNLNDADVQMSTVYKIVLSALPMGGRDQEKDAQSQWLKQRNLCNANIQCLAVAYKIRQQHLDDIIQNRVLSQGPF